MKAKYILPIEELDARKFPKLKKKIRLIREKLNKRKPDCPVWKLYFVILELYNKDLKKADNIQDQAIAIVEKDAKPVEGDLFLDHNYKLKRYVDYDTTKHRLYSFLEETSKDYDPSEDNEDVWGVIKMFF